MCSLGATDLSALSDSVALCRQFWKAGEYEAGSSHVSTSRNGQNRLRVHPKFLHSNATSHKWAFGAIAELLDNAVDEVQHGATFVIVDTITNPRNREYGLMIQDDGGGMDPESLRCCMSFGFSNKESEISIGQYGNGFKTSTMRLGADAIVFSRRMNKRTATQSVGLLSYTFLRHTASDDIVVPMVDYVSSSPTLDFRRLLCDGQRQFSSNLSAILKWSPFATEAELLNEFDGIGPHGTKVIIFNLWFNDDGCMELDFESDAEDILVSGAPEIVITSNVKKMINQSHIGNRFRYSLRVYSSILYLHLPENFRIILRGKVVEPHHIANDLRYCECIKYRPQNGTGDEVITTIGFLEGAPDLNVHGFNIYHKNRLILPFWSATNYLTKARGVAGVLQANFIKPTHDKQDFEKSSLYQKLETRLRDMTVEYWNYHCHLIGYSAIKKKLPLRPEPTAHTTQLLHLRTLHGTQQAMVIDGVPDPSHRLSYSATHSNTKLKNLGSNVDSSGAASVDGASQDLLGDATRHCAGRQVVTALSSQTYSTPGQFFTNCNGSSQRASVGGVSQDLLGDTTGHCAGREVFAALSAQTGSTAGQFFTNCNASSETGIGEKRRFENHIAPMETSKKQALASGVAGGCENIHERQHGYSGGQMRIQVRTVIEKNEKLRAECLAYEMDEKQLLLKVQKLRSELQEAQQYYNKLKIELKSVTSS